MADAEYIIVDSGAGGAPLAARLADPGHRVRARGHHASCTCKIGGDADPAAVLDFSFRVRGVRGVRVVDASVFPSIPGFFVVMPTYMISEKAADVIHADSTA